VKLAPFPCESRRRISQVNHPGRLGFPMPRILNLDNFAHFAAQSNGAGQFLLQHNFIEAVAEFVGQVQGLFIRASQGMN